VENNLAGGVQIEDSVNTYNLLERMKYFKIRGLSIAVVHDYKIELARGYGGRRYMWDKNLCDSETLFQAGSISKSLNGVGVFETCTG
jgi:CubicO group peptidase (beta-lactamase class C family)